MAQGRPPACRAADLNGAYATLPQGLILGGSLAGPFIAAGVLRFDGVGRFAGTASSSFGGFILNVQRRLQIPACSARNLKDNWTIQATGSIFSSQGVLEMQFAQNGRINFDSRNSFTGKTSSTGVGGTIVDNNVTATLHREFGLDTIRNHTTR